MLRSFIVAMIVFVGVSLFVAVVATLCHPSPRRGWKYPPGAEGARGAPRARDPGEKKRRGWDAAL